MTQTETKPDTFLVQRTASIAARPEKILPLIEDLREYRSWSPFEKMDPAMKRKHSGAARGVGATYEWASEGPVGVGRMKITQSSPSKVVMDLDFEKPRPSHNVIEFTLEPRGATTNVTWSMQGLVSPSDNADDIDRMVGGAFEAGLAEMKAIAEK